MMRKLAIVLSLILLFSLTALGLDPRSNPALIQWDQHLLLFMNADADVSIRQNLITVEDWNNFFDGATITFDKSRMNILAGDLTALLPLNAYADAGIRIGNIRLGLDVFTESKFAFSMPSEIVDLLFEGITVGEHYASGTFLEGWTTVGAGVIAGLNLGRIKLGANVSAFIPLINVVESDLEFSYNSSTETASVEANLSAYTRILSAVDPFNLEAELENIRNDFQTFVNEYAGIKLDIGIAYGDKYPLWGVGVRNITLKPGKALYAFEANANAAVTATLPSVEDATYTYDYSVASSTLTEPEESSIPMEFTGFLTFPMGLINLTLNGSYSPGSASSSDSYAIEATAWLPWKLLPISLSYGYESSGYYRKAASIGLNLHFISILLEGYVVSKQPLDLDPSLTPLSGGVSLRFSLGI